MVFGADADPDLPDGSYNVAPTDPIRVVVGRDDRRRLIAARWDFRPFWAAGTDRPRTPPWINARAETSFDSPAFGPALRRRRCIVPADAFYEWDRTTSVRQPYAIGSTANGLPLALAGVWSPPPSADDPPGVAILTTVPNELVETIHDRMPVILTDDAFESWLAPGTDASDVLPLLRPIERSALRMWPVSTAVNGVRADGPELLKAVDIAPRLDLA
jgi:putative SOS response-associated peptidase YedK